MAASTPVPAGVPSALLGNRPDVRSAEAALRGATARIGVAQAAWLPTFTITGQYGDRKSTRLNSSHSQISYAVFCLKKKKNSEHLRRSSDEKILSAVLRIHPTSF